MVLYSHSWAVNVSLLGVAESHGHLLVKFCITGPVLGLISNWLENINHNNNQNNTR